MLSDVVTQIGYNYFSLAIIVAFILIISEVTTAVFGWSIGDVIEFEVSMEVQKDSWLGKFFSLSKIGSTPSIIPLATFLLTYGMFGIGAGFAYSHSKIMVSPLLVDMFFLIIPVIVGAVVMCIINNLVYRLVPREIVTKIRYQSDLVGHDAVMLADSSIGAPARARVFSADETHFVRVEPNTHVPFTAGEKVRLLNHLGADTFRGGSLR